MEQPIELYQRSLVFKEKTIGPKHPDTIACYALLGHLYFKSRQYNAAVAMFNRVVAYQTGLPGDATTTTNLMTSLGNLAMVLHKLGDDKGALRCVEDAIAVRAGSGSRRAWAEGDMWLGRLEGVLVRGGRKSETGLQ